MNRIISLVILALLIVFPAGTMVTKADSTSVKGSVSGQVTVAASQPTISFALYSDSGYTTTTSEITPQTPVYMKLHVAGENPLEEFSITVDLFADTNNQAVGTIPSTTSPETHVNFTIKYSNGWVLQLDTGGSTTWNIQLDPNQNQPDPTADNGDFYIVIIFGKTAREAGTTSNAPYADWDIVAKAVVANDQNAENTYSLYGYRVYFYGEVQPSASTIDFGTIKASQSQVIQSVDGNSANSFSVTVIANGNFDIKATSDATWTDGSHQIQLVQATPGDGEFSLEIDDEQDTSNTGVPANPVYVASTLNDANSFVSSHEPTDENGIAIPIYMQINMGTNIYTGTYSGTINIYAVTSG